MQSYATGLAERGHKVTVFTANAMAFKKAHLPSYESREGITILRFPFVSFPLKYAFISPRMIIALMKSDVEVLQVFSLLPSFFILAPIIIAKLRGIRLVLYPQFHPLRSQFYQSAITRTLGRVFDRSVVIFFLKMADYIIALTYAEQRYYRALGIRSVTTNYEWLPHRQLPQPTTVDAFRMRFGISQSDPVILFVGRIEKKKGLDILVSSLPYVIARFPKVKLVVVGRDLGALTECVSIARHLNCSDRLVLIGEITEDEELSAAYSISNIVVIPSLCESYCRTVIEAWTFKKPVVVSRSVGLSELVTDDSGILVRPGRISDLEIAISELLSDPHRAKDMGERGRLVLNKKMLDLPHLLDRLIDIYQLRDSSIVA